MKNKNKLMILSLLLLLLVVIGATYAYFTAQKGSGGSAQIEVGAGTTDSLQFTNGNKINIVATQDNFQKDGDNQSDSSSVTATLTPNNTTNEAKDMYNVYLVIEDNEFVYTTDTKEAELVLKVVNPASTEVTSMNAVKYIDKLGFDITELKPGIYPIVKGYDIEASEEPKVDNWEITVTLINLNHDQNANAGKSFTGKVYITKDDLKENDLIKVNSIASTTTTSSINVDLKVGNEIGEVDKYYFAIEETTEKPEDIQTESVSSALAKEYEESPTATYAFTTIDGEALKEQQNYKIYGYGVDTKGFRSNIYETIVTTDEYQIPTIETVSHEETGNTTTLTITGHGGTREINKYQYSVNGGDWIDSDASGTIVISELEYNKSYEIRIRAVDEQERYSNTWVENIKIIKMGTEEYPYEIKYIEDLVKLSNEVNEGTAHAGEYFKLMNDLDFSDESDYQDAKTLDYKDINENEIDEPLIEELTTGNGFKGIGNYSNRFKGIFDGNNKSIKNIFMVNNIDARRFGFFGVVENGVVKNLTLSGSMKSIPKANFGAFAGDIFNSVIENCHNYVKIEKIAQDWSTGGIVGAVYLDSKIINCTNHVDIVGGSYLGGIIGCLAGASVEVLNCVNYGNVSRSDGPSFRGVGGIVGDIESGNNVIKNCVNKGIVSDNDSVNERDVRLGGIIGTILLANDITIDNCSNENDIINENVNHTYNVYMGGIIGYLTNFENLIITNSHNNGKLTDGGWVGGIIGNNSSQDLTNSIVIDRCFNKGSINSSLQGNIISAGLVGTNFGSTINILNSYNSADIKGHNLTSGFLGSLDYKGTAFITNSYNTGSITANNTTSGLIYVHNRADYLSNLTLNNVYNLGVLQSTNMEELITMIIPTPTVNFAYYDSSKKSTFGIGKEKDYFYSENFKDELNNNKTNITLNLEGYSLLNWKQGTEGYPILDYQNE